MALEVTRRELADRRRALGFWVLGIAGYVGFIIAFYPTVRDQADRFNEMVASYPEAMLDLFTGGSALDFASPAGFLNTYLFASMIPIMVLVLTIGLGAQTIAGQEGAGSLELLLSYPLSRSSIVLQKVAVLVVETSVIGGVIVVLLLLGGPLVSLELPVGNLVLATVAMVLLAVDFGLVALAVGAASGRKALASGAASGLAAATYLVNTLGASWDWLRPARRVSPFYWATAGSPLADGVPVGHLLVLLAVGAAATVVAVVGFDRRDLRA